MHDPAGPAPHFPTTDLVLAMYILNGVNYGVVLSLAYYAALGQVIDNA
jgi:hypothetical protein